MPGLDGLGKSAEGRVGAKIGKAKAAAQGPLKAVRGTGEQEAMLESARIGYADNEHRDRRTYTVDQLAHDPPIGNSRRPPRASARDVLREEDGMQKVSLARLCCLSRRKAWPTTRSLSRSCPGRPRRRRPRRSRSARTGRARPGASSSTRAAPGCALE